MAKKKIVQKTTSEGEVLEIAVKLLTKSDLTSFTTDDIYTMVLEYMQSEEAIKQGEGLKEDDNKAYKGRNKTRLKSKVQNLISHKKLNRHFLVKKEEGQSKVIKGTQTELNFETGEVVTERNLFDDVVISKPTAGELDNIRAEWLKYAVVTSNSNEGVLRLLIEKVDDETLMSWVNENGGPDLFEDKLKNGLSKIEPGKGIPDLDNFDEMSDLLLEAILSNKPTLIIRDYDNDGVSCQVAMDTLLAELEAMGVEHKVHVKQTHGGEIRGINEQDVVYFKELEDLYSGERLEYLFTMDNGVSSNDEIVNIFKKMKYKKNPKTGIIDHHTLDENVSLGDSLHLNPELNEGDPAKPSAGGIVAAVGLSVYTKYCERNDKVQKDSKVKQLERVGAHANLVDMVDSGINNLPENNTYQKKAAEMGALMNVYIKYEGLFRDENKLRSYLENAAPERADILFRRFLAISKQAKIILDGDKDGSSLMKITADYIDASLETEGLSMDKDSISDLRVLAVRHGYSVDKDELALHELSMSLFKGLKKLDKEVGTELRKDKSKHILGDYMIDGVFLRIYNPESKAPTKAIDTAFPKPTTGYTISLTPKVEKDGSVNFARGGFRSTVEGGHSVFQHLNNEVLEILFKGHLNAAGAFVHTKTNSLESFVNVMKTQMKKVAEVIKEKEEKEGFKQNIIKIDRDTAFLLPAISTINDTVNATLFAINAGFDIAIKGEYLNSLLEGNNKEAPYKSIPVSFAGSVFIVPNNKYNDEDNIVFNCLPDGSWITAGSVVQEENLITDIGAYDKVSEIVETKLEETYEEKKAIYEGTLNHEDLKNTIGVAAGVGHEDEGVKEAVGLIAQTMLDKQLGLSVVYDIETKGSTRGVNVAGLRTDTSTKGKIASEVINGQFLIRKIRGGESMNKKSFKRKEFYVGKGKRVLLSEDEFHRISKDKTIEIKEKNGEKHIKKDLLRTGSYERIYSYEEKESEIVYNHSIESRTRDFLLKSDGEIPISVVLLTHLNKVMTDKYGHSAKDINEGVDKLFKELFAELKEDEKMSFAAHNIAFDLDMTPNTIPVMKDIESNPRIIVEDTTRAVKEILKEYTSFGEFKYGEFNRYIQAFQNHVPKGNTSKKEDLFTSAYVVEDFLAKKEVGYVINLAESDTRFEYRRDGEALVLLYVNNKTGREEVVIEDVTDLEPEQLRGLVRYNVPKPTKYSMQMISNLATVNGLFFLELTQEVEVPEFLGGLFDTFGDEVLTKVQKEFLNNYKFTYSSYQNMVALMRQQIEIDGQTNSVEGYIRDKAAKQFINDFPNFSDKEKESFMTKANFKQYLELGRCALNMINETGHKKIEEYVDIEKSKIEDSLYDFLITNKELGKLYELKILTYSILPYLDNIEFPLTDSKEVTTYVDMITNLSGVQKETVSEIMRVINENAKKLGHSPFHVEPHLNIGNLSDTIMESYLLSLFITLNERDVNRRNYLVSQQTLATIKSRNGSNIRQNTEEEFSKEIGVELREGITDEFLKSTNEKTYIAPKKELTEDEYQEIIEDLESMSWFNSFAVSLRKKAESLEKQAGTVSMRTDGTVIYDKDEKKSVLEKVEKGEELSEYGKGLFEVYMLDETYKSMKEEGEKLAIKIEKDNRYDTILTSKVAILRKINDNTFDFLSYILKSKYYAEDDRKEKNKWTKRMLITDEIGKFPEGLALKEELEKMEREFLKAIMTDPKIREHSDEIKSMVRNFLLAEVGKNITAIKDMSKGKVKTFANPLKIILENGIPNGLTNFMKITKPNSKKKDTHP